MTSPNCRTSRDDDCSTCAPSPAFSSGFPSPSLPISKFDRPTARPQDLFGEDHLFWGSLGSLSFSNFGRDLESPRSQMQDSFAPIYEEDDGFHTPRMARVPTTPPGAPKKAAAPPLMKVLQANTASADTAGRYVPCWLRIPRLSVSHSLSTIWSHLWFVPPKLFATLR